ncbi:Putative ribosome biogenesis GTPase RsgA [Pirellulimonas nuda]|uniref:Small ribosomal subunit biogenesis GTPase RsgA n=1 Tax=Pirellulimonas nuda TaxID=2528009 RepID=A0A518DGE2_9BACT|nr:ribosome small subunit-dependent GTPase A [Pirellulimonas nuda]QDU90545.1 Putative ribosome biogenesis GTPase RsgA [Pirellulimonas nuda]
MAKKKPKVRAEFRKNHDTRARQNDLTQRFDPDAADDSDRGERVTGKGRLTRRRTVAGAEVTQDDSGSLVLPEVDRTVCRMGRVLRVQGLVSIVQMEDGRLLACATRQLLKQLSTELRHVVAAGDRVWVRPEGQREGVIERVEPRTGVLSRSSRGRQHLIVVNVDQVLIVASAAEPRIKPNLIDRYLLTCEKMRIRPIVCINKIDLVDPVSVMPLAGVYSQLGYDVLCLSARSGQGLDALRRLTAGKATALSGQSGVGKSSLLNALDPGLALRIQTVSAESQKGRHTTTTAELIPLADGGWVVDTPGIRQFQLWDTIPKELDGYFRELRPYVSQCRYPDCTHTHEDECAVKNAVADNHIDPRRYESFLQMQAGDDF